MNKKRRYNYKNVENKSGEFNLKIRDVEIATRLDDICYIKNYNKSIFCIKAIKKAIDEEFKNIKGGK